MTPHPSFPDLTGLSADELRPMVVSLLGTVAKLEAQVIALTEEIARLKKLKGRPKLKPSGMEKGTDPGAAIAPGPRKPRRKGRRRAKIPPKSARLIVDDDRVIPLTPGPGWRFKGYKRYTVQDLVIEVRVVRYWRACYQTPEGNTVIASLPAEVSGHYGPNLRRFLLSLHYQCRVTMPLLHRQLQDFGLLISAGQISNMLTKDYDDFHA